ncbi:MAG TPA: hypothetical protein VF676_00690 [Flavobacterium sp.]|jgi:hypothetical protein
MNEDLGGLDLEGLKYAFFFSHQTNQRVPGKKYLNLRQLALIEADILAACEEIKAKAGSSSGENEKDTFTFRYAQPYR